MKRTIVILLGVVAISIFAHPDINNDGSVDLRDYARFQQDFGSQNFGHKIFTYRGEAENAVPQRAMATLTFTANPLGGETVTIDFKTYTFQIVLTDFDGHVLIGDTTQISIYNLSCAISIYTGNAGITYAKSTTSHPTVRPYRFLDNQLIIQAREKETGGNGIPVSETLSGGSWDGETLAGGAALYENFVTIVPQLPNDVGMIITDFSFIILSPYPRVIWLVEFYNGEHKILYHDDADYRDEFIRDISLKSGIKVRPGAEILIGGNATNVSVSGYEYALDDAPANSIRSYFAYANDGVYTGIYIWFDTGGEIIDVVPGENGFVITDIHTFAVRASKLYENDIAIFSTTNHAVYTSKLFSTGIALAAGSTLNSDELWNFVLITGYTQ